MEGKHLKVKKRMPFMMFARKEVKRLGSMDESKMTLSEKILFVFFAIILIIHRKLNVINWEKFGDNFSIFICGVTTPFWIWAIASYINVVANNIFSPELIWEYNFFVVMLEIFG